MRQIAQKAMLPATGAGAGAGVYSGSGVASRPIALMRGTTWSSSRLPCTEVRVDTGGMSSSDSKMSKAKESAGRAICAGGE